MSLDEVLFPDAAEAEQAWATIARTGVWLGYVSLIRRDGTNCRLEVRMSKAGGEGEGLRYAALVFDADVLEARLPRALPAPRPGAASLVSLRELRQRIGIALQDALAMPKGPAAFGL